MSQNVASNTVQGGSHWWEGSRLVVGGVVLASLALAAILVVPVENLITYAAVNNIAAFSLPNDASSEESARIYAFQILAVMSMFGVVLALIGAMLGAAAHERNGREGMEYVGKLFGVAAAVFALTGAIGAIDESLRNMLWWVSIVALVLVIVVAGLVWLSRR